MFKFDDRLTNRILSISAILVSAIALFISLYEVRITRQHQKKIVWPYIELGPSYDNSVFSLYAINNGLGPALVTDMEVIYEGQSVDDWTEMADLALDTTGFENYWYATLHDRVVKSGENVELFGTNNKRLSDQLFEEINNGKLKLKVCYHSIYDDHYLLDNRETKKVRACTILEKNKFNN